MEEKKNDVQNVVNQMTGNSDLITKRYYDSMVIEQRLIDSELTDVSMEFYNHKLDTPVMLGVIGRFSHLGENPLMNSALAAKELNTVLWVSSHISYEELKQLIDTGAKVVQVVKPYLDEEKWLSCLKKAEELGCVAVASDIDHAYGKDGGYDGREDKFGPKSIEQLSRAVNELKTPFILKGILSVQDALKAKQAGVKGIVLSHHHNIMNYSIPPAMLLPEVRKALGEDYCILIDCGINSASEGFKALALGASGLCVARPYMAPLAKEGKDGVIEFVKNMTGGIKEYLNRTSSKDIKHIDSSVIHFLNN